MEILNLKEYLSPINEASMDETYGQDPKKSLLLFSDTVRNDFNRKGGRFPIFYEFYDHKYDNNFFGLKLTKYDPAFKRNYKDIRFTLLTRTNYKDTETTGRKQLFYDTTTGKQNVKGILSRHNKYYFYNMVQGDRHADRAPNRDDELRMWNSGEKRWILIIERGCVCSVVKSKSRQEGGAWLETILNRNYGWDVQPHEIKPVYKIDNLTVARGAVQSIFQSGDDTIFGVLNSDEVASSFVKYDFVIDNEYKLEVKRLKRFNGIEKEIWSNGKSQKYQLAETLKIADRKQLKNLVKWYNDLFLHEQRSWEYKRSMALYRLDERRIALEFSLDRNGGGEFDDICDQIRNHYNSQIVKLLKVLNQIPKNRWMAGVHGIYFGGQNRIDRRWDFVIKLNEGIRYQWKFVDEWLGFKRLKLFIYVSGDAWEYILADGNRFIRTFQLKDWEDHIEDKRMGVLTVNDGTQYKYNSDTKIWNILEE